MPGAIVRRWVWCSALLTAWCASGVSAQTVTSSNTGFSATRRGGDNAAEEQGRTDWPRVVDGASGTQVHITFDPHNVDVVLMTGRDFGLTPLFSEARRLAESLHRPEADFITFLGKKTANVDVELNDYLEHPERGVTHAELDLSGLAVALRSSGLPRPVVLHIDPESADLAAIYTGGRQQRLTSATFLGVDEVKPGSRLRFESRIPWYAPIIATGFGLLAVTSVLLCMWMPWRLARRRREQARLIAEGASDDPPDPEEVQKQYDKQPAIWKAFTLFPILLLSTALFGNPERVIESAFYVLPASVMERLMLIMPLGMVVGVGGSALVCMLVERARTRREGLHSLPVDPDEPPAWTQKWWFALMGFMMLVMMGLTAVMFSGLPRPPWLVYIPFGALGVMFLGGPFGAWLAAKAVRTTLPEGDRWHDLVQSIAAQAGVPVKHVVRIQSTSVNAYASAFGTVGLTSALLRKMEPDEVRAVIAHEVGHLRGGHARRNLFLTLGGTIVVLAAWWGLGILLEGRVSKFGLAMLRSPMFTIFLLPMVMNLILGKGRRQREEAADRFAVEVTGDPELVIRMLTRLHTLDATPHQLKRSDEAISTHPSLVNRIAAIRKAAAERGSAAAGDHVYQVEEQHDRHERK